MIDVRSTASPGEPWRTGAAVLRLSLAEFAAVANSIPGLALPEGFRPRHEAQPITATQIARSLAEAGLLLRDGDDVVLCPQLTGLLRLFGRAAVTLRLRVRLRDTDDDPHVRWLTDVALGEGRGARLTRATVLAAADACADGAMDGGAVAISGFTIAETVPQLLGCVPRLRSLASVGPDDPPHREIIDVVQFAARTSEEDRGALSLEIRSRTGRFVDVWSHDGRGWRRVLPDGAGRLVLTAVRAQAFAAELSDVLSESVLMELRDPGGVVDGQRADGNGRGK